MLKFSRNIFFITLLFVAVVATPIYAIFKIVVPDAIIENLENALPDGVSIQVGMVSSKANLEIVYNDVRIWSKNFSLIIPQLSLKPVINLRRPILLSMTRAALKTDTINLKAKNVNARLKINGLQANDFSIEGQFEGIGALEDALISQGNFIIAGINSSTKELDIDAQKIELTLKIPTGFVDLELVNSKHKINLNKSLSVQALVKEASALISLNDNQVQPKKYIGKSVNLQVSLDPEIGKVNWVLPINLSVKNIEANQTYLFDQLNLKARAEWRASSSEACRLIQVLSKDKTCGRLTDVVDVNVKLKKNLDAISFEGNGYCVAPRSGCRQTIKSHIKSQNTEKVFSRLLVSKAFNPVVTSILMGVLLNSPTIDPNYSHSVDLDVTGTRVLVNKKPLF